jgi:polysaccharide deacetylase family protein (PEP-CTERM system associated)
MQVLSFDVEEHWRIEAASGLSFSEAQRDYYAGRVGPATRWILEQLARFEQRATFFLVGQFARQQPDLVRDIHCGGHELGIHSWDHRRIHHLTPEEFREDVRQTKDVLEQITGEAVVGYRAPTFSIVRQTGWALDVLVELGLRYDSSIYPVRHDRYGVHDAPRGPFLAQGLTHQILELPPARLDLLGLHLPAGGGGYFRLFPLFVLEQALAQIRENDPPVAMLYFHPWEFDPDQARLPLGRLSRFRTYAGMARSRPRLVSLLRKQRFVRAIDAANFLEEQRHNLPRFGITNDEQLSRDAQLTDDNAQHSRVLQRGHSAPQIAPKRFVPASLDA